MNDFCDRSFYTRQTAVFECLFDISPAYHVSDDSYSRLCHVTHNLPANLFLSRCSERHDETFEQTADRLGKPTSALVASSYEDRHPTGLVAVIVSVALVIFAIIPVFLFMTECDCSVSEIRVSFYNKR